MAIPLVYLLAASVLLRPVNTNIAFIEKELGGLKEYKQALSLYFELYESHHPEIIIERIKSIAETNSSLAWQRARREIESSPHGTLSTSQIAAILRTAMQDIGDESNLILDPVLESYYAVDLLIDQIPLFLIWGTSTNTQNIPMPEVIAHYSARLDHALRVVSAQSHDNSRLEKNIADLKADWEPLLNNEISASPANVMLQHVRALSDTTMDLLEVFLNKRLAEQRQQRIIIISIIIGFYIAITTLIVAAMRNYVSKREVSLSQERQKLVTQLAQKNDELEKFAHAAAHDLKEPVRTMRCFATLLKSESPDELTEATAEYVNVIENTAQRAEQMINDLLGYTQVSEEALAVEHCDCNKEVAAVLQDLKPAIDAIKPEITIATLPSVQTVPSMFRRVILNLIDNAIKYRKRDALLTIHIHAEKQDGSWLFSVRDNGIGLASEHTEMAFEPFKRLEPALHTQGSGIGLTSCKKIIERLGGRIWIASDLDQGTTIYFTLPLTLLNMWIGRAL